MQVNMCIIRMNPPNHNRPPFSLFVETKLNESLTNRRVHGHNITRLRLYDGWDRE